MAAAGSTTWEINLKDYVSGGLEKLTEHARGTQKKINEVTGTLGKAELGNLNYGKSFSKIADGMKSVKDESHSFKHAISEAGEGLKESLREIPGIGGLMGLATNPISLGVAAIGGGLYEATKHALEFEHGMTKINATAQISHEELGILQKDLQEIGSHSGGQFDKMPEAFNIINKKTHDVELSKDILQASVRASETSLVDLNVAGEATAKMAGIIGKEYRGATDVMDTFFTSIKSGNGDVNAMMQELPHLAELGKGVGLNWKETAGVFNYFTSKKIGETAEEANTDIMGMLNTLRSADVIKKFHDADVNLYDKKGHLKHAAFSKKSLSMFDEKGEMRSFDKIIESLKNRMDEIKPSLRMDFLKELGVDDPRKAKGLLMLMEDVDGLKKSMQDAKKAAGGLNDAFEGSEGIGRRWGDVADTWKEVETNFGTLMLPVMEKLVDGAQDFVDILGGKHDSRMAGFLNSTGLTKKDGKELSSVGYYGAGEHNIDKDRTEAIKLLGFMNKIKKEIDTVPKDGVNSEILKLTGLGKGFKHDYSEYGKAALSFINTEVNTLAKKHGNSIVDKIKEANDGKPPEKNQTTENTSSIGSGKGELRSLVMNVHNTIVVKEGGDATRNIKQQVGDALVDAARDAMVTIGTH